MKVFRALLVCGVLMLAVVWFVPPVRIAALAVLLLPHFFPGDVPRPLQWLTPTPQMQPAEIPGTAGRMVADVYRPTGGGRKPAMVLFLGVNPLPRNDPQVSTLADGIARTGIVTVVAESRALLQGEIGPEEVDHLVALFEYLERDDDVDPRRIGFAGFCIGAVLELLAAADERIADRVAYVNAFSVYADPVDVLRAILTQTQPGPTGPERWTPGELTRTVFIKHLIGRLDAEQDRRVLTREFLEGPVPSEPELATLSPLGGAVRLLLGSHDRDQIDRLLGELPPGFLAPLEQLSPQRTAHRLRARVFLMHDADDAYLPVAGARELFAAMPASAQPEYTEFRMFSHVVPGQVADPMTFAGEMAKLAGHVYRVLLTAHTVGPPG